MKKYVLGIIALMILVSILIVQGYPLDGDITFSDAEYLLPSRPGTDVFQVQISNNAAEDIDLTGKYIYFEHNIYTPFSLDSYGVLAAYETILFTRKGTGNAPVFASEQCTDQLKISILESEDINDILVQQTVDFVCVHPEELGCFDSDYGTNLFVKGTTSGYLTNGEYVKFEDYCRDGDGDNSDKIGVEEGRCIYLSDDQVTVPTTSGSYVFSGPNWFECEYGCEDGACVEPEVTCYDSDGTDIFNKGYVDESIGDNEPQRYYDACDIPNLCGEGNHVLESDCDEYGAGTKCKLCPAGCSDGACSCLERAKYAVGDTITTPQGVKLEIKEIKPEDSFTIVDVEANYNYNILSENVNVDVRDVIVHVIDIGTDNVDLCINKVPCTDSDDGEDLYRAGTTYGVAPFICAPSYDGSAVYRDDKCDGDELTEYFCSEDGKYIEYSKNICSDGCSAGACVKKTTLQDFPSMFVKDGKFNGKIVVGDTSSASATLAASEILTRMQLDGVGIDAGQIIFESELDKSVKQNLIIIGAPCKYSEACNSMLDEIKHPTIYEEEGMLILQVGAGGWQLLVTGYTDTEVRESANVLIEDNYLKCRSVRITDITETSRTVTCIDDEEPEPEPVVEVERVDIDLNFFRVLTFQRSEPRTSPEDFEKAFNIIDRKTGKVEGKIIMNMKDLVEGSQSVYQEKDMDLFTYSSHWITSGNTVVTVIDGKEYEIEVINVDEDESQCEITVNGEPITLQYGQRYDSLAYSIELKDVIYAHTESQTTEVCEIKVLRPTIDISLDDEHMNVMTFMADGSFSDESIDVQGSTLDIVYNARTATGDLNLVFSELSKSGEFDVMYDDIVMGEIDINILQKVPDPVIFIRSLNANMNFNDLIFDIEEEHSLLSDFSRTFNLVDQEQNIQLIDQEDYIILGNAILSVTGLKDENARVTAYPEEPGSITVVSKPSFSPGEVQSYTYQGESYKVEFVGVEGSHCVFKINDEEYSIGHHNAADIRGFSFFVENIQDETCKVMLSSQDFDMSLDESQIILSPYQLYMNRFFPEEEIININGQYLEVTINTDLISAMSYGNLNLALQLEEIEEEKCYWLMYGDKNYGTACIDMEIEGFVPEFITNYIDIYIKDIDDYSASAPIVIEIDGEQIFSDNVQGKLLGYEVTAEKDSEVVIKVNGKLYTSFVLSYPYITHEFSVVIAGSDDNFEDADQDGVPDEIDECPETKASHYTDIRGCSCDDLDCDKNYVCSFGENQIFKCINICGNGVLDRDWGETDIDCGGPHCPACDNIRCETPNECLDVKPKYCNSAKIEENDCQKCGCPESYTCNEDGSCYRTVEREGLRCLINQYEYGKGLDCSSFDTQAEEDDESEEEEDDGDTESNGDESNHGEETTHLTNQELESDKWETLRGKDYVEIKVSGAPLIKNVIKKQAQKEVDKYNICVKSVNVGCVMENTKCVSEGARDVLLNHASSASNKNKVQEILNKEIQDKAKISSGKKLGIMGLGGGLGLFISPAGAIGGLLLGAWGGNSKISLEIKNIENVQLGHRYECPPIDVTSDQSCKEYVKHGSHEDKADVLFIGDGFFEEEELELVIASVVDYYSSATGTQYEGLFSIEPFKSNKEKFNIWYMVAGDSIGHEIDDRQMSSGPIPMEDDTMKVASQCPNIDYVIVLSKSGYRPFATFNGYAYCSLTWSPFPGRLVIHELGHSFARLSDEYYNYVEDKDHEGHIEKLELDMAINCAENREKAEELWGRIASEDESVDYFESCGGDCGKECASYVRPTLGSVMNSERRKKGTDPKDLIDGPPFEPYYKVNERAIEQELSKYK